MLIDGGDTGCSNRMYSYLKRNEISTLDIVVASHAHVDHVGGLSGALNYATAELLAADVLKVGHPTDNVLSRLRDAEVTVLRTDLHGDITIGYDGSAWFVFTEKEASEEDVFTSGEDFARDEMIEKGYDPCGNCAP